MLVCFSGQILHQAITTPILYDFYNYDVEKKEFNQLFVKFTQVSLNCKIDLCGFKDSSKTSIDFWVGKNGLGMDDL